MGGDVQAHESCGTASKPNAKATMAYVRKTYKFTKRLGCRKCGGLQSWSSGRITGLRYEVRGRNQLFRV